MQGKLMNLVRNEEHPCLGGEAADPRKRGGEQSVCGGDGGYADHVPDNESKISPIQSMRRVGGNRGDKN
jgi:hypothetical protein